MPGQKNSYSKGLFNKKDALTKEQYDDLVEQLGYPPTWVPVRRRPFTMNTTIHGDYYNQVKPLPSS